MVCAQHFCVTGNKLDEFNGDADGERFQTIVADAERHIPLDVLPTRKKADLIRYPYSNGFTEGCNNKTKVLKRVCFGLRNFEHFRNRILFCSTYA